MSHRFDSKTSTRSFLSQRARLLWQHCLSASIVEPPRVNVVDYFRLRVQVKTQAEITEGREEMAQAPHVVLLPREVRRVFLWIVTRLIEMLG